MSTLTPHLNLVKYESSDNVSPVGYNTNFDTIDTEIYGLKTDYVVSQGTNGIWTYRKWASGIAECWGIHSETISKYTTWAGFYGYKVDVTFPFTFAEIPIINYSAAIGTGYGLSGTILTANISTTSATLYAVSSLDASVDSQWYVNIKGRWQ